MSCVREATRMENLMNASVVIITYYRAYELRRLLNSLLKQVVKPIEVFVVDDTPTSEIEDVCIKYTTQFGRMNVDFVYFRKKPSERSVAISRNIGAKNAHGDVVMFMNSDLILYPDYVKKVLGVFSEYPEALGVGSWIGSSSIHSFRGFRYYFDQTLKKFFSLVQNSVNSCKRFEYPIALTKTINCEWLLGGYMSFRRLVFSEFKFDENLRGLAWGEDYLFSSSVYQRYPKSLLLSPVAKYIHAHSEEGRSGAKEFDMKIRNAKYILTKLWGFEGLLIFSRQYLGLMFFGEVSKLKSKLMPKKVMAK